jgi:hypothetical protein
MAQAVMFLNGWRILVQAVEYAFIYGGANSSIIWMHLPASAWCDRLDRRLPCLQVIESRRFV